eukprot:2781079-Amphidinium_carterae.1
MELDIGQWETRTSDALQYCDSSRITVFAFTVPLLSAPCFTARSGGMPWGKDLLAQVPELSPKGTYMRKAEGCMWETIMLESDDV